VQQSCKLVSLISASGLRSTLICTGPGSVFRLRSHDAELGPNAATSLSIARTRGNRLLPDMSMSSAHDAPNLRSLPPQLQRPTPVTCTISRCLKPHGVASRRSEYKRVRRRHPLDPLGLIGIRIYDFERDRVCADEVPCSSRIPPSRSA